MDSALDDPQGPRGMGPYALFQANRQGNGIRPRPYSRDMTIQPVTYDSIKTGAWLNGASLSTPHGIGHAWNSILWDMNWDLVDKHDVQPRPLRGLEHGRQQPLAPVRDRRPQAAGLQPRLHRRPQRHPRRHHRARRRRHLHGVGDVLPARRRLQRRAGHHQPRRQHGGLRHPSQLPPGLQEPGDGALRNAERGGRRRHRAAEVHRRRARAGSTSSPSNSPFSRKVDCTTLQVPSSGAFITPREYPIATETPGNSGLSTNGNGQYHYNWKTLAEWVGHLPRGRRHPRRRHAAPRLLPLRGGRRRVRPGEVGKRSPSPPRFPAVRW